MKPEVQEEITRVSTNTTPEKVIHTTRSVVSSPIPEDPPVKTYQKKKVIFRTYQILWYILGIVEVLLGFRVALKALGANPFSGFTNLIYTLSDPLALPFRGILGVTVNGASVFEWSTFIAVIVYALITFGLVELMQFIKPVTPEEVEQNVDNQ